MIKNALCILLILICSCFSAPTTGNETEKIVLQEPLYSWCFTPGVFVIGQGFLLGALKMNPKTNACCLGLGALSSQSTKHDKTFYPGIAALGSSIYYLGFSAPENQQQQTMEKSIQLSLMAYYGVRITEYILTKEWESPTENIN